MHGTKSQQGEFNNQDGYINGYIHKGCFQSLTVEDEDCQHGVHFHMQTWFRGALQPRQALGGPRPREPEPVPRRQEDELTCSLQSGPSLFPSLLQAETCLLRKPVGTKLKVVRIQLL